MASEARSRGKELIESARKAVAKKPRLDVAGE